MWKDLLNHIHYVSTDTKWYSQRFEKFVRSFQIIELKYVKLTYLDQVIPVCKHSMIHLQGELFVLCLVIRWTCIHTSSKENNGNVRQPHKKAASQEDSLIGKTLWIKYSSKTTSQSHRKITSQEDDLTIILHCRKTNSNL